MPDIQYVINDPTTPDLIIPVDLPVKPDIFDFRVEGYIGATPTMYTPEHQAAQCHYNVIQAINLMTKFLKTSVKKWSSTNTLYVIPRAGKQFNAYYDRVALRFFFGMDPVLKQMVYASNSSDIVLHETGHALLDAIRPDLYNVQAFEIWGFHEGFADAHAILNLLQNDLAVDYILKETGGNLAQSCVMSRLGEEIGRAIYNLTGGSNGNSAAALRDAYNSFTYIEPEKLPRNGKDNQLTSEPHSFSRVFSGMWYEILVAIYEEEKKTSDAKTALLAARDVMTNYTFNAVPNAPATIRFYDSFAKAMLVQDKMNNSKYNQLMNNIFIKRGILRQPIRPAMNMDLNTFKSMCGPTDEITEHPDVSIVVTKSIETLTMPNFMVHAPNDTYYEFDSNGECVEMIGFSKMELIDHANSCVDFLKEKDMIRPDKFAPLEIDDQGNLINKPFEIDQGHLTRRHFSGCFINNCLNPGQPEFNKCWKSESNAGCGCGNKNKKPTCSPTGQTTNPTPDATIKVNGCGISSISSGQTVKFGFNTRTKSQPVC